MTMPPMPTVLATSTLELTLRMGVALTLIVLLLAGITRFARGRLVGRGGDRPSIDVAYQRQLTKHATLSLVTAGDRHLLIASNNQAITLLAEGDDLMAGAETGPGDDSAAGEGGDAIDIRSTRPGSGAGVGSGAGAGSVGPADRGNPIRALQNLTVRRG
ncbi:MAG: hypothetical protein AAF547_18245 [Actinomycetota bacterium]